MLRGMFIGNHRRFLCRIRGFLRLSLPFSIGSALAGAEIRHKIKPHKAESPKRQHTLSVIGKTALQRVAVHPRFAATRPADAVRAGGYIVGRLLALCPFAWAMSAQRAGAGACCRRRAHA